MGTMYWITILGNLCTVSTGILIVLILVISCYTIRAIILDMDEYADEEDKINASIFYRKAKKLALCSIIPMLILIFVPSKNQLYAIYGVGTVIDYAKGSKEAQKLPDNVVKALNVWLENVNKDKKDSINND